MSCHAIHQIRRLDLTPGLKEFLKAIALYVEDDLAPTRIFVEALADDMSVTPRRIQQLTRTAVDAGLLRVTYNAGRKGQNEYTLTLDNAKVLSRNDRADTKAKDSSLSTAKDSSRKADTPSVTAKDSSRNDEAAPVSAKDSSLSDLSAKDSSPLYDDDSPTGEESSIREESSSVQRGEESFAFQSDSEEDFAEPADVPPDLSPYIAILTHNQFGGRPCYDLAERAAAERIDPGDLKRAMLYGAFLENSRQTDNWRGYFVTAVRNSGWGPLVQASAGKWKRPGGTAQPAARQPQEPDSYAAALARLEARQRAERGAA